LSCKAANMVNNNAVIAFSSGYGRSAANQ